MKKLLLMLVILLAPVFAHAQGPLEPPAGVPSPTMKTLDQVEPRTPIHAKDLPTTITKPGSYYLAENVKFTNLNTDAITINCSNVTLDLMGFSLNGPGMDAGLTGSGIAIKGAQSYVCVRNGNVCFWRKNGIGLYNNEDENVHCPRISEITASENGNIGIAVAYEAHVDNCRVFNNNNIGIDLGGGVVDRCLVSGNINIGIRIGYAQRLVDMPAMVTNCRIHCNTYYGIWAFTFTTVSNNSLCYNGRYGAVSRGRYESAGIYLKGTNSTIRDNEMIDNSFGITVDGVRNHIVRNFVSSSGGVTGNYLINNPNNLVGPIVEGMGTVTTSNPFTNFSNSAWGI